MRWMRLGPPEPKVIQEIEVMLEWPEREGRLDQRETEVTKEKLATQDKLEMHRRRQQHPQDQRTST